MATITIETLPIVDALARIVGDEPGMISRREAARLLGVSHGTIANWLAGKTTPALTRDLQIRLAKFLGISTRKVAELFGLDLRGYFPLAA